MKKDLLFICFLFIYGSAMTQITTESIDSKVLKFKQSISIKLPKNYDENSNLKHPIIVVLDGHYLFTPVIGQTDFQTYFENMPSSIIVGINHENNNLSETFYDDVSGLTIDSGVKFSEFISKELLPYLDKNYNTNHFRVVVGHERSASLMNAFLLKEEPVFQAYVNLSPEFIGDMSHNIIKRVQVLNKDIIYYMATSTKDVKLIRANALIINNELKHVDNKYFKFYFDDFDGESHHAMVMSGIARGFEKIFDDYKPISGKEMNDEVVSYEPVLD